MSAFCLCMSSPFLPPNLFPSCSKRQNNSMLPQPLPASMHPQIHHDARPNTSSLSVSPSLEGGRIRQNKIVFCDVCISLFSSTENVVQKARILSSTSTQPSTVKIYTVSLRPAFSSIRDRDSSKPFLPLASSFFPSKAQN